MSKGRGRGRPRVFRQPSDVSSELSDISSSLGLDLDQRKEITAPIKRLYKEYVEVKRNPLEGISVAPLPSNFFEWHGNIRAPEDSLYKGGVFHFSIVFKTDHPKSPPILTMRSRIKHPCVSNGRIKLDTLCDIASQPVGVEKRYYYYSCRYTALSILLQLQVFLYEGTAEIALEQLIDVGQYMQKKQEFEAGVTFSVEQSLRYSCEVCRHRPKNVWPPLPEPGSVALTETTDDVMYQGHLVCYNTLKTPDEAALGLGISFTKNIRTGHLKNVECASDVLSLNAYKNHKVREIWQHKFTHWIPIYLVKNSPERASYLAKRTLSTIYQGSPTEFQPEMVLDFFPKLLLNLALSFSTESWYAAALRILRAYCYIHRLFLHFLQTNPELLQSAKDKINQFIANPEMRNKENVPSLGEVLCLLGPTKYRWEDIREVYVEESLARGVLWIVKKHPELDTDKPDPKIDGTRLAKSFAIARTGMAFLLCHLSLNRHFAAPDGVDAVEYVASQYDKHWSLISWKIENQVWNERKEILAIEKYSEFYPRIGLPAPSDEEMLEILRKAVVLSRQKRYHGDKGITVLSPEEFEKERLGKIKSLDECVTGDKLLHDDESQWKEMCETRFGLSELPDSYSAFNTATPWKHLYLQYNLQELVGKLNDNPDFKLLYQTLSLSKETLTCFELISFKPDNIKSGYYFLARILEKLPKLARLTIIKGYHGLGETGFKELVKGLANSSGALEVLDMAHSEITVPCVRKLAESHLTSEGLKVLNLEGNPLSTEGACSLAKLMMKHDSLPNLEELNLKKCQITDPGIKELAKGLIVKRKIKKLKIGNNPFGVDGLAHLVAALAYNPVIEEVELTKLNLLGPQKELCSKLAFLFKLTVSLKKLNFWSTPIAQYLQKEAMTELSENTYVEELDLGSSKLGSLEHLSLLFASKKTRLHKLIAESNRITSQECKRVNKAMEGRSSSIKELDLSKSDMLFQDSIQDSPKPLMERKEELPSRILLKFFSQTLSNVTHLNLSHSSVLNLEIIGETLKRNTSLNHLNLSFNAFSKIDVRHLTAGLMENTRLEYLRLDHCSFGATGAHFLAQVLSRPSCILKELHVFCNYFEVPGVRAICHALKTNRHLQFLDLGMNKVRKNGAAAIVEMLQENKSLTKLHLKFNYIPDPWALRLMKTVTEEATCSVSEIKLAGNSLQYSTLVNIVSLLKDGAKEIDFDLTERADYLDPEKLERTVFVSPLAANVTKEMVKKLFYSNKCGAIISVKVNIRKKTTKSGRRRDFDKAKYAFVEFAHKDSVELAMDLVHQGKATICGSSSKLSIVRAGLGVATATI